MQIAENEAEPVKYVVVPLLKNRLAPSYTIETTTTFDDCGQSAYIVLVVVEANKTAPPESYVL